VTGKDKELI